ncbi:hypothetical protein DUI87_17801 [Hirundo rustica rustica]|uniref:Uncharacterized protein n=1 Tax=Hirundo rustica rustica TaxID=333673 RepID=A0A3M0JZU0_HIRRU|nr:hypothetical protein DUI87_17801 [Hirundo rustica rustica]
MGTLRDGIWFAGFGDGDRAPRRILPFPFSRVSNGFPRVYLFCPIFKVPVVPHLSGPDSGEAPPAELPHSWIQHGKELELLERSRGGSGMIPGMEQLCWESWECSPGEEKLWDDLSVTFQDLKELQERWRERQFPRDRGTGRREWLQTERQKV